MGAWKTLIAQTVPVQAAEESVAWTVMVVVFGVLAVAVGVLVWWFLAERRFRTQMATITASVIRLVEEPEAFEPPPHEVFGPLATALERLAVDRRTWLKMAETESGRLRLVLDALAEGVIACDDNQRVILVNEVAKTILRLPRGFRLQAESSGMPLLGLLRVPSVLAHIRDATTTGDARSGEFEQPGPQRRIVTYDIRPLPILGGGAAIVLRDVTELRRLEQVRHELIANVSHELKTPLSAIKGYAETLKMWAGGETDRTTVYASRIEEQADRLHRLIVDMLQIGRIESGAEVFHPEVVVVSDLVDVAVESRLDRASARSLTLEIEPGPLDAEVFVDAESLIIMVTNLIDNAINATAAKGCVTATWQVVPGRADPEEPSRGERAVGTLVRQGANVPLSVHEHVAISVRDTGLGIPPEHQARIFERFYRVDPARSRQMGGTGLGLAIVKNLAQTFGGSVTLASEVGVGSTFTIRLPRVLSDAGIREPGVSATPTPPRPSSGPASNSSEATSPKQALD